MLTNDQKEFRSIARKALIPLNTINEVYEELYKWTEEHPGDHLSSDFLFSTGRGSVFSKLEDTDEWIRKIAFLGDEEILED